jgi:hypothetical protein
MPLKADARQLTFSRLPGVASELVWVHDKEVAIESGGSGKAEGFADGGWTKPSAG